jgi:hypothetical protein
MPDVATPPAGDAAPAGGAESSGGGADDVLSSWFPTEPEPAEPAKPEGDQPAEPAKPEGEKTTDGEGGDNKPADGANELEALKAQLAELEPFKDVVAHLKQQGLDSAQAIQEKLAQQNAETALQTDINQHAARLHQQFQAKVDADELTPEQAQAEFDREIGRYRQDKILSQKLADLEAKQLDYSIQTAIAAHPEVQASGKEATGLIKVLHQATGVEVAHVAKFVNELVTGAQTRAVTAYAAKQAETAAKPTPVDSGNGGAPPAQQGAKGNWQSSWADILGIK